MKVETEIELGSGLREHRVALQFNLEIARKAPRLSSRRYDETLGDPGDPGSVEILRAWLVRGDRRRELSADFVDSLNEQDRLAERLYADALEQMPCE